MNIYNGHFDEYIEKAKRIVEEKYGVSTKREWLESYVDSYGDKRYRIKLLVWEGSTAKGYVIINYGTGMIRAYGVNDKLLKTYDYRLNILNESLDVSK